MNFPAQSPVKDSKLNDLRTRIAALGIDLNNVSEKFIKSSGPGGQKANKTSSGVELFYEPLGIRVKWTRERSRSLNRFLALRELVDEVEHLKDPENSTRAQKEKKIRRQKDRRRRRSSSLGS